jgi:hypothetical protein
MQTLLIVLVTLLWLAEPARADWRSEFNAGNAAFNSGDLDVAIAYYTKAIELKPNEALVRLGQPRLVLPLGGAGLRGPARCQSGRCAGAQECRLSTPEEKGIGFPEQKYISEAGKKGR